MCTQSNGDRITLSVVKSKKLLDMNHKLPDSICDNLVSDHVVTNWVHTVHANRTFVTKTIPVVTNSYPHGDSYKPCQWLWQCDHRVKWKFTYLAYLAMGRVPILRTLMMMSQKGRWQMFAGFSEHHQTDPPTMAKPTACSYACQPIHQKEWRGAITKLALRSGTRRLYADMFGELLCCCCPRHIFQYGVWR